jgi:hypothetical protein
MKIKPMPKEVSEWLESQGHKGASVFRDRTGQVIRAYKDKPYLFPGLDEKGVIFELMMRPTPFLKFGRSGAPHWRNFALSTDRKRIVWTSPNKRSGESQVLVSEIKYVENSQKSTVFQRLVSRKKGEFGKLAAVSLSIFYSPHGKAQQMTLDVMCKHPDLLRIWCMGIELLVADFEKSSPADRRAVAPAASAAAAAGEDDEDDDDAAEDAQNLITGFCKAFTWGVGGWGQLGRAAVGAAGDAELTSEADGMVGPMNFPVDKKKKVKVVDVRVAACGGGQTVTGPSPAAALSSPATLSEGPFGSTCPSRNSRRPTPSPYRARELPCRWA